MIPLLILLIKIPLYNLFINSTANQVSHQTTTVRIKKKELVPPTTNSLMIAIANLTEKLNKMERETTTSTINKQVHKETPADDKSKYFRTKC